MTENQVSYFLEKISANTLLIEAEDGFFKNSETFYKRIGKIRKIKHEVVKGSHHLHMQNYKEVANRINRFMGNY